MQSQHFHQPGDSSSAEVHFNGGVSPRIEDFPGFDSHDRLRVGSSSTCKGGVRVVCAALGCKITDAHLLEPPLSSDSLQLLPPL